MRFFLLVLASVVVSFSYQALALTDPTRPQDLSPAVVAAMEGVDEQLEPTYQLQYVLVSEQLRYAVIDGQRVMEGQTVGSARVLRIQRGSVRIRLPGETRELKLGYSDIKSQGRISR